MVLEDFGDKLYQFELSRKNAHSLYAAALDEMIAIQKSKSQKFFLRNVKLRSDS